MAFLYETHLHTLPVSRCGHYSVRENLEFYKSLGYEGVFITNHFIDGNINIEKLGSDLRREIDKKGKMQLSVPGFGKFSFTAADVDKLMSYMKEA